MIISFEVYPKHGTYGLLELERHDSYWVKDSHCTTNLGGDFWCSFCSTVSGPYFIIPR